jgi:hypothetical protein
LCRTGLRSAEAEVLEALPDSQIQAAMHALPEGFRAAVYYADVHGYTYAETAAILSTGQGLHDLRRQSLLVLVLVELRDDELVQRFGSVERRFLCCRHGFLNPNLRLMGYPDRNPRQQYPHVLTSQKTSVR